MNITIFNKTDLKKSGEFKKKSNIRVMNEQLFKDYVKDNNLSLSKGYIDNIGFISNGLMFKCNYKGLMIGVTSIIDEVSE